MTRPTHLVRRADAPSVYVSPGLSAADAAKLSAALDTSPAAVWLSADLATSEARAAAQHGPAATPVVTVRPDYLRVADVACVVGLLIIVGALWLAAFTVP